MRSPHHDGSPLYVSNQNPSLGEAVTVRVRIPEEFGHIVRVVVRSNPDHEPHWDHATLDGDADGWQWWSAQLTVANPRHGYRFHLVHSDGRVDILTQAGLTDIEALDADDFALVAGNEPPAWMDDAVMYQIFPDRFARSAAADERPTPDWAIPAEWSDPVDQRMPGRSTQFYGGDLDGIVDKLDHLQALGVTVIYHTPIFPARSNHRYDASSFDEVDPLLGGDEAYIRLIEAAHARGMRVMGDLTSNHCGDAHDWFRAAHGHPGAPESDFFSWADAEQTEYASWLGVPSLPKFDWHSGELRRRFIEGPDSVVAKWLAAPYSTDGWRIDVANMTGRLGATDLNAEVRTTLRRTMSETREDTLLIAESTNDATSDLTGDAWHGAMTYATFTRAIWAWLSDPQPRLPYVGMNGTETTEPWFFGIPGGFPRYTGGQAVAQIERFSARVPWRVRRGSMLALDTHDIARFRTQAAEGTVPVALGLSLTLPGIPVVYAGDEFGLIAADGEAGRMPMPWGSESEPEVAETLQTYRTLINLRHRHPVLSAGGLRWLAVADDAVAFIRESAEESVLVIASRADATLEVGHRLDGAEVLYGEGVIDGDTVTVSGPTLLLLRLGGVAAP